jgi:hypothetical protein
MRERYALWRRESGDSTHTSSGQVVLVSLLSAHSFLLQIIFGPSYDEYDNERAALSIIFLINPAAAAGAQ